MFKCRFKQQSNTNYRSPIIAYNKYRTQQRYSIYANTTTTYANQYGIVVQESRTNEGRTANTSTMIGTKGNIYLISNDNSEPERQKIIEQERLKREKLGITPFGLMPMAKKQVRSNKPRTTHRNPIKKRTYRD